MNRMRRKWTPEEDALLRDLVQKEVDNGRPLLWRELAEHIPGRSNKDCRKRWWNSLAGGTVKGAWSPEEDRRLSNAVEKYGMNWTKVATVVGSRCGDQCSSHWRQVLDPNINFSDWTSEEDERLLMAVRMHGTNWSTIALFHTPQRTTLALKNQYSRLQGKSQEEGRLSSSKQSSLGLSSPRAKRLKSSRTTSIGSNRDGESGDDECDEEIEDGDDDSEAEDDRDSDVNHPRHLTEWHRGEERNPSESLSLWAGNYKPSDGKMPSGDTTPPDLQGQWMESTTNRGMSRRRMAPLYPDDMFLSPLEKTNNTIYPSMPFTGQDFGVPEPDADLEAAFLNECRDFSGPVDLPTISSAATVHPDTGIRHEEANGSITMHPPSTTVALTPELSQVDGSHRVSIDLTCTTAQLANIMSLITSKGLAVNIKIDTP